MKQSLFMFQRVIRNGQEKKETEESKQMIQFKK